MTTATRRVRPRASRPPLSQTHARRPRAGPEPSRAVTPARATDCRAAGQMLAALMGWPQGAFASELTVKDDKLEVTRRGQNGRLGGPTAGHHSLV